MNGHVYMYTLFDMFVLQFEPGHMFGVTLVLHVYVTTKQAPDWMHQTFYVYIVIYSTTQKGHPA